VVRRAVWSELVSATNSLLCAKNREVSGKSHPIAYILVSNHLIDRGILKNIPCRSEQGISGPKQGDRRPDQAIQQTITVGWL
jgi:hypothetical protein